MMDGTHVLHVDKVDSPERYGISSRIGSRAVPHLTSLGKAILAAESPQFTDAYLRGKSRAAPPYRIEDIEAVRTEIERTRARGYSIDNEEDSAGVRCLGIAILGPENRPLFAISVTGPAPRFTLEKLYGSVGEVIATAESLSARFGWKPEAGIPDRNIEHEGNHN
jgi:DNA-binding IclR family transcriptional regulator